MRNRIFLTALLATTVLGVVNARAEEEDLTIPSYEHCVAGTATCQTRTKDGQTIYYTIKHDTKTVKDYTYSYDTMVIYGPTAEGQSIDIPANAFYGYLSSYVPDSVYKLDFSGNIGSIGAQAFGYAHLSSIVIPDTVTSVNSNALWGSITYNLGNNVLYCPSNVSGCSSLSSNYTVVEYSKNQQTGVYTAGENTYASTQDMQNNVSCSVETGECATKVAQSMVGNGQCGTLQACTNLLNMVSDSNYTCDTIASCSTYANNPDNNIVLASLYGGNTPQAQKPTRKSRLIYTIEEANEVAKPTGNTVRIKYR